jgi:hypothetical protein
MPGKAVTAERVRDLKTQIEGLSAEEVGEILFLEISPGREPVTVYSAENGAPTLVPAYRINEVMGLTDKDGNHRFVSDPKDAPEYIPGTVKCFLHRDSPERPILELIGLSGTFCPNDTLASEHSKRVHGLHRHKQEWAAYQEHVENRKEEAREARQDKQLEATLSIARTRGTEYLDHVEGAAGDAYVKAAAENIAPKKGECDICGKDGFKNVGAHKRGAHKED